MADIDVIAAEAASRVEGKIVALSSTVADIDIDRQRANDRLDALSVQVDALLKAKRRLTLEPYWED